VLFLIPVPWIGPVLAPIFISIGLIVGALLLLGFKSRGIPLRFSGYLWGMAVGGGLLVLASFMIDFRVALLGIPPPPFRWWLFGGGAGLGIAALAVGVRRLRDRTRGR
jgi:hypothetical protein